VCLYTTNRRPQIKKSQNPPISLFYLQNALCSLAHIWYFADAVCLCLWTAVFLLTFLIVTSHAARASSQSVLLSLVDRACMRVLLLKKKLKSGHLIIAIFLSFRINMAFIQTWIIQKLIGQITRQDNKVMIIWFVLRSLLSRWLK
jgi:hypothetical protein